jgi:hypothetical protein
VRLDSRPETVATGISEIAVIAEKAFQKSKRSDLEMKITSRFRIAGVGLAAAVFTAGGCSSIQPSLLPGASPPARQAAAGSNQPPPRVQDCWVLNNASPREFACRGKVYTSFQLAKLREDWEKNHPDYNSGFFFEN